MFADTLFASVFIPPPEPPSRPPSPSSGLATTGARLPRNHLSRTSLPARPSVTRPSCDPRLRQPPRFSITTYVARPRHDPPSRQPPSRHSSPRFVRRDPTSRLSSSLLRNHRHQASCLLRECKHRDSPSQRTFHATLHHRNPRSQPPSPGSIIANPCRDQPSGAMIATRCCD